MQEEHNVIKPLYKLHDFYRKRSGNYIIVAKDVNTNFTPFSLEIDYENNDKVVKV